jgi:hypothetical protein
MPQKYRVVAITDDPPVTYENLYTLSNAMSFARIGTQKRKDGSWSEDRAVARGRSGPVVRVYSHSERIWPIYADHVNKLRGKSALRDSEVPKKLWFKIGGKDRWLSCEGVAIRGVGRAIPTTRPWREKFLKKHPSWR